MGFQEKRPFIRIIVITSLVLLVLLLFKGQEVWGWLFLLQLAPALILLWVWR
jgi:hypothetical protein